MNGLNWNEAPAGLGRGWAGAKNVEFGDGAARVHLVKIRFNPSRPRTQYGVFRNNDAHLW